MAIPTAPKKKKAKKKASTKKSAVEPIPTAPKKKKGADFGLNPKQSLFCEIYATSEEFFGNGTKSYMKAYGELKENVAAAAATRLLSNVKICEYINECIELSGFNDQNVDKQLALLINQHSDGRVKVAAIKEYNALKQRVTKKLEVGMSPELITFMERMNSVLDSNDD